MGNLMPTSRAFNSAGRIANFFFFANFNSLMISSRDSLGLVVLALVVRLVAGFDRLNDWCILVKLKRAMYDFVKMSF
jgi:hypothetical protein